MKIEIEVKENTSSDIADIICFMAGFLAGKGDDFSHKWLDNSLNSLREVNAQIKSKN
jgi:hypothetical protein